MKELLNKIISDGTVLEEDVLKVDSFLTHQVDPELMSLVQDRIQTKIQNVMTVSVNNELKTCDCEAYLPNKRVVLYRENKKNGAFTDHYKQGATFKYKAQLKEDGQILFNGNIE